MLLLLLLLFHLPREGDFFSVLNSFYFHAQSSQEMLFSAMHTPPHVHNYVHKIHLFPPFDLLPSSSGHLPLQPSITVYFTSPGEPAHVKITV